MLDFDASKLLIIGVVALVVIGPKDLPRVLRQVGQAITKLRRMASEFQGQFMDAMKEADLQDLQKEVAKLKDSATLDVHFDPVRDVKAELSGVLDVPAVAAPSVAAPAIGPVAEASHTAAHEAGAVDAAAAVDALPPPPAAGPVPEAELVGEAVLPGPAGEGALPAEAENAAYRTAAEVAGAIGAPAPPDPSQRRKIVVPKRRAPGDRRDAPRPGAAVAARSRPILPPRRGEPRT